MQEYKEIIGDVAAAYWGSPNLALSKPGRELRFGTHGSKSVDLVKGTWFDHELNVGGGAADLIRIHEPDARIVDRLEAFGLPKQAASQRTERVFDYTNADGSIAYQVVRIDSKDGKTYRQRRVDEHGEIVWGMTGVTALPYRLHELARSTAAVFIVEGEKCADAVASLGLVATTNHGGAGKWWPPLVDHFRARNVVIIPDNDAPGERHARVVADALTGTARSIRILRLPGLASKGDVADWIAAGHGKDELTRLAKSAPLYDPLQQPEIPAEPVEQKPAPRVQLVAWSDVQDVQVKWLVQDLIPASGFAALYGKPGSYKSFVALYLAAMIATGRPAFGKDTTPGEIVYIMGEGGAGLKPRRDALMAQYDLPNDIPVHFIRAQLNLRSSDEDAQALVQAIGDAGLKPSLIVIDTLARAFAGGNENASEDVGAFIMHVGKVQAALGAAILVVHHSGKDEARGMRGHSSLLGAVDAELEVVKLSPEDSEERVGQLTVTKQKDGEDGFKLAYKMETVQLSKIDDSKQSLAVVPVDSIEDVIAEASRRAPKMSANQQMIFAALKRALADNGERVAVANIPADAITVPVSLWRQTFFTMSTLGEEARKKAFQRGSEGLTAKGTVNVWANYAWISNVYE